MRAALSHLGLFQKIFILLQALLQRCCISDVDRHAYFVQCDSQMQLCRQPGMHAKHSLPRCCYCLFVADAQASCCQLAGDC
ncbi:hypothetical protein COO60DRAFT_857579 [Scenedesmus sp. NREL 46B-D3]|nr:hypothetical protein COO60DRAFT_857579 [Scenedesmus sp. NREL 46B-D3]